MLNLFKSFKAMLLFTLVLGVVYPFFIMSVGYTVSKDTTTGSQEYYNGKLIGSKLIGQVMPTNLFQTRPSASNDNPLATGGTNYAVNNKTQLKDVKERVSKLQARYGSKTIPEDMVFASASGIDPDISLQAANYQAEYVAKKNNLSIKQVEQLVEKNTTKHLLGIDTVNVLNLNIDLLKILNKRAS
ncbi:potassium-transporting ATPase subunit C [Francisella uliginis]|uniref:Potassium-transporting ATPase KdpC subunit n=1 Tax=Francisella uliginis TaxID=573570 RepID=A0A1L4BUV7_9GAMM|nr:potassium-transporting ATPase subunit C [Francisella uliginis]API87630.1 ATPase [Francisella uliginis]